MTPPRANRTDVESSTQDSPSLPTNDNATVNQRSDLAIILLLSKGLMLI